MALSAEDVKVSSPGNGSQTAFTVPFVYWDDTDVAAVLVDSDGDETALTLTTHYTLSGGNGATGTLTMVTAPADGETLVRYFNRANQQDENYSPLSKYPAAAIERGLDKLSQGQAKLEEQISRCLKIPISEGLTVELVKAASRAGKALIFDANGNATVGNALGTFQGTWATATDYSARDMFLHTDGTKVYIILEDHTSTSIAADLADDKIALFFDSTAALDAVIAAGIDASEITFDPAGLAVLAATDVQGALEEVDTALTGKQALNAILTDLAGLTQAADKLPYFDSGTTAATTDLTSFARTMLAAASAAAQRIVLGLEIGANVQAYSANLDTLAAVSPTSAGTDLLSAATVAAQRTLLSVYSQAEVNTAIADYLSSTEVKQSIISRPHQYQNGVKEGLNVPMSPAYQLGTTDFYFVLGEFTRETFEPSSDEEIASCYSSNLGWRLVNVGGVSGDEGKLRLDFGNGTDMTTHQFMSTVAIPYTDGSRVTVGFSADRDGNLIFAINGEQLGDAVDISGASAQTLDNAAMKITVLDNAGDILYGQFTMGLGTASVSFFSEAYANWENLKRAGLTRGGRFYASDFSSTTQMFDIGTSTQSGAAITANETVDSVTECLKLSAGSTQGNLNTDWTLSEIELSTPGFPVGTRLRVKFDTYFESPTGTFSDVRLRLGPTFEINDSYEDAMDVWVTKDYTVTVITAAATQLLFQVLDEAGGEFANFTPGAGDFVAWKNFLIEVHDEPMFLFNASDLGLTKKTLGLDYAVVDTGDDYILEPVYPAYATSELQTSNEVFIPFSAFWDNDDSQLTMVPSSSGYEVFDDCIEILDIYAKSDSGEYWVVGDENDPDRYFAEATIGTSWEKLTLANTTTDGTNLELRATPMDGAAAAETRTDVLQLMVKARYLV